MVYRPPKKKPEGSGFPRNRSAADPLEGPLSGPAGAAPGDDRNLVMVDDNYVGGDFEDRMWIIWRKQRSNIVSVIAIACVAAIGWQGWQFYQAHLVSQLQEQYQAATDGASLLAFAQAHPTSQLGKLAQMEAGDAFYKAGQFKDAASAYEQAVVVWSEDNDSQRARMGEGLALLQSGQVDDGKKILDKLANDTQAMENFRAEASFYLAVLAAQANDHDDAAKWIEKVKGFKTATNWISQANMLADTQNELSGIKVTSGNGVSMPAAAVSSTPINMAAPVAAKSAPAPAPASTPAPTNASGSLMPNLVPLTKTSSGTN